MNRFLTPAIALALASTGLSVPAYCATASAQARTAKAGPGAAVQIDRDLLVGRWTDDGDCRNAVHLIADGRFVTASGAAGVWSLDGDRLTMTGTSILTIRVTPVDRDTLTVLNADGSVGHSSRCPDLPPASAEAKG